MLAPGLRLRLSLNSDSVPLDVIRSEDPVNVRSDKSNT